MILNLYTLNTTKEKNRREEEYEEERARKKNNQGVQHCTRLLLQQANKRSTGRKHYPIPIISLAGETVS